MRPTTAGSTKRIARLQSEARDRELDAVYLYDPKNIGWATGFFRDLSAVDEMKCPLLCVPGRGKAILFTSRGLRGAPSAFKGAVLDYVDYDIHAKMVTFAEDAVAALRGHRRHFPKRARRVGIDGRYLPAVIQDLLREWYPRAEFIDVSPAMNVLRAAKDADEVAVIRKCIRLDEIAYRTAREAAQPGATEAELHGLCYAAVARETGEPLYFNGDFVAGYKRCRIGGGPATNYRIKKGDVTILDLWVNYHGYWADMSRTFVIGRKPTVEEIKVHDLLLKSMETAARKFKPGTRAKEIYQAVHDVLEPSGWAKYWTHHAGHGIGCHPHEAPTFIPASNEILREGMICTLEPGVYRDGFGGMRIEDDFLITRTGCERLSRFPHGL